MATGVRNHGRGYSMTLAEDVLTAVATSGAVSALATLLLKTYLENRIRYSFEIRTEALKHQYEMELEKLRSELQVSSDAEHEIVVRRLTEYSRVAELVYRIRNMSREIATSGNTVGTLSDEVVARTRELEDSLYQFRIDLQRDGLFPPLHTFKNTCRDFSRLISDVNLLQSRGEVHQAADALDIMRKTYQQIESLHAGIIGALSRVTESSKTSNPAQRAVPS